MSNASEIAYRRIRGAILDGALAPGDALVEQDLAATLGVSRTPVREALRRLQADGLVEEPGNRRAIVKVFTESDVLECFELRALLESHAAAQAADRITDDGIAALSDLAVAMETAVESDATDVASRFSALNDEFHRTILAHAQSPRLNAIMTGLMEIQLVMARRYGQTLEKHLKRSCRHHRELIAALKARDPDWAAHQMRAHLLSARRPGD